MAGAAGTNKSASSSAGLMACSALMVEATRSVCQSKTQVCLGYVGAAGFIIIIFTILFRFPVCRASF